ncbi:excisionase family DNA binding protein [Allocatelliglobosispora scoriae]|uniref:Excisionase family DNA binding protein n=1 Tax=Allocatelliglobosispora scoriae TaxID=643052 RepID=A0A841BKQ3_9ACTN|nr:helix-turn-helix domain-containing protein [Allocatelliglobosispora scoriae]MBB5869677.1 excisionase family DNA binding protein [Allocatelliglobosispora scoriae]
MHNKASALAASVSGGKTPSERRFYSVAETAEMLGLSEMTVYRAIKAGEFPAVRVRGRVCVPVKAIDAMVDAAWSSMTVVDAADFVSAVTR